jgi:hypothetical protein
MNSELLEALIEAGIPAVSAERVANAVQAVAVGAGKLGAAQVARRLPASPEAKYDTFIPGDEPEPADAPPEASLGVGGPAVFFAGVQVGGELAVNNLLVRNNAVVQNLLNANRGRLNGLAVPFHLDVGNNQCVFQAPAVFQRPVVLLQNGDFRGQQNLFTGGIVIQGQAGQVNWNGQPCDPARVTVITEALAQGDTLTLNPKEVLVLRDLGDQQALKFKFAYTPDPKNVVVDMTTQEVTFLTSAVFDAENCVVNTETATGWVVTAVTKGDVADVTGDASVTPQ